MPQWLLVTMLHSGLFDEYRIPLPPASRGLVLIPAARLPIILRVLRGDGNRCRQRTTPPY